jgi:hypothetical protein
MVNSVFCPLTAEECEVLSFSPVIYAAALRCDDKQHQRDDLGPWLRELMALRLGVGTGLMNCILLSRLLGVFPDLFEKVNFWAGTSNGGMLAMAFAFGYSPALCRTLLELAGTKVFIKRYPPSHTRFPVLLLPPSPLLGADLGGNHSLTCRPSGRHATEKATRVCSTEPSFHRKH